MNTKNSIAKTFLLTGSILALLAATGSANLTIDLRASQVSGVLNSISGGGKTVTIDPVNGGNITLQIWAQVTNAAPVAGAQFGIQSVGGSIVSTSSSSNAGTGTMQPAILGAPFNIASQTGTVQELSTTPDGVVDLGQVASAVTPTTSAIFLAKDGSSGGAQNAGAGLFFASNLAPAGATFQAVTNGFEFLMGTATLSLSSFSLVPGASVSVNWVFPANYSALISKKGIAAWTQGDNLTLQGNSLLKFVGSSVNISTLAVPEPSAFGMLALGALGLVGFRRMGLRRTT